MNTQTSKILVVQTGFFGDLILSTAVFSNLRLLYPDAHITVLTTVAAKTLIEHHPAVDAVMTFDKRGAERGLAGFIRMRDRLRAENFSLVLALHKSARTSVLLWLSGIKRRVGFREAALSFLYTKRVRRSYLPHEALRNLVILEGVGADISKMDNGLSLGIDAGSKARAAELLEGAGFENKRLVGIAPGSVWPTKRWTPSGFAAVADEFTERGYAIVIIGGPQDVDAANAVEQLMERKPLNLAGAADFMVSAAIIERLDLLVSNDSAPLHIASACRTPVVAAFCATVPEFGFGPWGGRGAAVGIASLSCRPCGRHGGNDCPTGTHACQLQLRPEQVFDAASRLVVIDAKPHYVSAQ